MKAAIAQSEPSLDIGDTLNFSVVGTPEVQREIPIGLDGSIFLPLVGSLPARGLTLTEFRAELEQTLRKAPIRIPDPSGENVWRGLKANEIIVEIGRYRPIFVGGDVSGVGEIEFRAGMTVRQAVVKAGGIRKFDTYDDLRLAEMMSRRDLFRNQIAALEDEIARLRIDLQRISSGAGRLEGIGDPDGSVPPSHGVDSLPQVGRDWLVAREELREMTRNSQRLQLQQMENRLGVLQELQKVSEETVRIEEENLARLRDLADRGVATASSVDDARQDLLQSSSRALEAAGELFRLEVDITQARDNLRIDDVENSVSLLDDIEDRTARLSEVRAQYDSLQRYLATLGADIPADQDSEVKVYLYRSTPDEQTERAVALNERVMPGDVLEVEIVTRD